VLLLLVKYFIHLLSVVKRLREVDRRVISLPPWGNEVGNVLNCVVQVDLSLLLAYLLHNLVFSA